MRSCAVTSYSGRTRSLSACRMRRGCVGLHGLVQCARRCWHRQRCLQRNSIQTTLVTHLPFLCQGVFAHPSLPRLAFQLCCRQSSHHHLSLYNCISPAVADICVPQGLLPHWLDAQSRLPRVNLLQAMANVIRAENASALMCTVKKRRRCR